MGEKGHYFRSDGNGGYVVKKDTLYIILGIISLCSLLIGVGVAYAGVVNDVSYLKEQYKVAGPEHTQVIKDLDTRVALCEKNIEITKNDIGYIKADVSEIKGDIKLILAKP